MNIEKNIREDHQAELTVEVEAERMEAMKRRAARKISERGKIPGFRPGKAPYEMIRRHYGDEAILETAVDMLVEEIYPQALEQAEIEPSAMGTLEKVESMDPPKFVFRVPMMPVVELGDYLSVRLPYEFTAPGDEEMEKSLVELRRMYATTEMVEREAQEGDYVLISVTGAKADAAEGDDPADLSRENTALVVRAEDALQENEWPFQGFCREMIGLKAGDTKTIQHTYADDFEDETVRGAAVTFEVSIKTVRAANMPELNDDFARTVSEKYENLEQLKEELRKQNEANAQAEYDDEYFAELIDKVKESATIKYPPQVMEHEAGHVLEDLKQRLASQGMDLETYFKLRNTTQEKFIEEEVNPVAKKRLERGLLLDEIARQQKIRFNEASLRDEFDQTINQLAYQGMDFNQLTRGGRKGQEVFSRMVANESAARLMTRNTLERLKVIALGQWTPELLEEKKDGAEEKVEESAAASEVEQEAKAE
ncbi:MAG: Trigger factor [Anaerolineales bacterium]|nr:Trigger factor [Anaerolineales bacterium]